MPIAMLVITSASSGHRSTRTTRRSAGQCWSAAFHRVTPDGINAEEQLNEELRLIKMHHLSGFS